DGIRDPLVTGVQTCALPIYMMIWDIMGEKGFRELLKDAYFYGANGILAVADFTRRRTLDDLDDWIDGVEPLIGKVPVLIVVNKADLTASAQFVERDVAQFAKAYGSDFLLTSAKTGGRVESAFARLSSLVVEGQQPPAYTRSVSGDSIRIAEC